MKVQTVQQSAFLLRWLLHVVLLRLALPIGLPLRIGGTVVLAVLAIAIMAGAIRLFKRIEQDPAPWKPTPEIFPTDVYRFTRNPMYVSMALLQAAIGVGFLNGWIVMLVAPAQRSWSFVSGTSVEDGNST